jgi:predicted Zn finger-like uncharacterized protein
MRLICPNCAAQYEVDDGVIPEAGRDVQCSNCGHTWWQEREQTAAAEASAAEPAEAAEKAADAEAPAAQPAMAEAGAAAEEARWPEEDAPWEDDALPGPPSTAHADRTWPEAPDENVAAAASIQPPWPEAPPENVGAPAARPQRTLDDAVLEVLRQEAEREAQARKTEDGPAVETQPDLGLAEAQDGGVEGAARERMEAMKSLDAGEAEDESGRPERRVRRSKLPDVDEINSTLAGQQVAEESDGRPAAIAAANARRSGFRTGFTLMILIAIAIGAVYAYADRIVAAAPAAAPAMESLVATLDSARIWLDKAAISATEAITSLTEGE